MAFNHFFLYSTRSLIIEGAAESSRGQQIREQIKWSLGLWSFSSFLSSSFAALLPTSISPMSFLFHLFVYNSGLKRLCHCTCLLTSYHSFIHSFHTYLLSIYYLSGIIKYCRGTINKVPVLTKHMLVVEDRKISKERFVGSSIALHPYIAFFIMVIAIFNSITFIWCLFIGFPSCYLYSWTYFSWLFKSLCLVTTKSVSSVGLFPLPLTFLQFCHLAMSLGMYGNFSPNDNKCVRKTVHVFWEPEGFCSLLSRIFGCPFVFVFDMILGQE